MRPIPRNARYRNNKPGRGPVGNPVNRVYDSAGPDGKVRGTPQQIIDKYHQLSRDASTLGDHVAAESYLQHAEHYARILTTARRAAQQRREERFNDAPPNDSPPQERNADYAPTSAPVPGEPPPPPRRARTSTRSRTAANAAEPSHDYD